MTHAKLLATFGDEWLVDVERGFAFFFRPRCGSSTLTRWFFENLGYTFGGFSIAGFRREWADQRREELVRAFDERYDDIHKFVVVRDPFDRAVSSYLHAVNNPADYQWDVIKPKLLQPKEKHDLTFRQFVAALLLDDLDRTTPIWRRQSALVCWERGVDDIVPLSGMNDYLISLNERYGLDTQPGYNSITVASVRDDDATVVADVAFRELLAYKGRAYFEQFPSYRRFYDAELKRVVSELYQEDLALYARYVSS